MTLPAESAREPRDLAQLSSPVFPGCSAGNCVGVVVAIPEPLASELRTWRKSFGDPLAEQIPAHITLVTTTPVDSWEETLAHVRSVAATARSFTVSMHGTGTFRPVSPVVYLNVEDGFAECIQLHSALQRGPLARDLPFPFHPHVTIAHNIQESSLDDAETALHEFHASFRVDGMGLFQHDRSGIWRLQEELAFGGATH